MDSFVNYLTAKVTYPTQKIIQLRNQIINYLNTSNDDRETQINNERARQRLGLRDDTNDDLMFLVEKRGIKKLCRFKIKRKTPRHIKYFN